MWDWNTNSKRDQNQASAGRRRPRRRKSLPTKRRPGRPATTRRTGTGALKVQEGEDFDVLRSLDPSATELFGDRNFGHQHIRSLQHLILVSNTTSQTGPVSNLHHNYITSLNRYYIIVIKWKKWLLKNSVLGRTRFAGQTLLSSHWEGWIGVISKPCGGE